VSLPLAFPDELEDLSTFSEVDDWQGVAWLPKALKMMPGGVE
jgi:hypothetical protein